MSKSGPVLILDIDSASLGACIVTEGERPILAKTKRVPLGTGATRDAAALTPLLKDALTTLLAEYVVDKPESVLVALASPWFAATLKTLSSKSDKPSRVSKSTVERVVQEHKSTEHDATAHLESLPISVAVNGYQTRLSSSVLGTSVSVSLYQSDTDHAVLDLLNTAIKGIAPKAKIIMHTTPLIYAETIVRMSGDEHGIIVDVGGEVSDVVLITRRSIGFVGSVPEGSRSITRTLAGKGSLADADSRLIMMASHDLTDQEAQTVAASLDVAAESWQKSFNDLINEAGKTMPVPHHVFLVGERDELSWFERVAAKPLKGPSGVVRASAPTLVLSDFFKNALAFAEGASFDSSLALAALFFHIRSMRESAFFNERPVLYSLQ